MLKHLSVQKQQKQLLDVAITVSEKLSCIQHSLTNMEITTSHQTTSLALMKEIISDLIRSNKKRAFSKLVLFDLYYQQRLHHDVFSVFFNILSINNTVCNRGQSQKNTSSSCDHGITTWQN